MNPRSRPELSRKPGTELPVSGVALAELLKAVVAKRALFRFKARGTSMAPFIRDGDIVTIAPLNGATPRCGDVIAFVRRDAGTLRVHRVIGRQGAHLLIRGDNVPCDDEPVDASQVLGRVQRVERKGRRVLIGSGPERMLIAFLSRQGWLGRTLAPVRKIARGLRMRRPRSASRCPC